MLLFFRSKNRGIPVYNRILPVGSKLHNDPYHCKCSRNHDCGKHHRPYNGSLKKEKKGEKEMSRSYKKIPISHSGGWLSKQSANRIVRSKIRNQADDNAVLPQKKQYRKMVEQYSINDYICYWSKEEAEKEYERSERLQKMYPNKKTFLNRCWAKQQKRK